MSTITKDIEIDLNAMPINQPTMELIYSKVALAREQGFQMVNVTIKRIPTNQYPRLIVDYGDLFETLCAVAKEYKEYRAAMESVTTWECRNHPPGLEVLSIVSGKPCPACGRVEAVKRIDG